jgi:hypothetical protein
MFPYSFCQPFYFLLINMYSSKLALNESDCSSAHAFFPEACPARIVLSKKKIWYERQIQTQRMKHPQLAQHHT